MFRRSAAVRLPSVVVGAVLAVAALVAGASPVLGCPSCQPGRAARAAAFGPGFWTQLVSIALPFLIAGTAVAFLYRIGRPQTGDGPPPPRR